jgi:O-antigen/teichoic acid export membrane protein
MLFLGSGYGAAVAGAFLLTQRVLGAPLAVVGSAVMDAYKQGAAASYAAEGCRPLTLRTIKHLTLLSLLPWLAAVTVSPWLFRWVFGEEWRQAGVLCQLLATPFFLRFITTPVSYNFYLSGRQNEDLVAQGYNLGSNAVLLWLGSQWGVAITTIIAAYAANLTLVYVFYLARSVALSRPPRLAMSLE